MSSNLTERLKNIEYEYFDKATKTFKTSWLTFKSPSQELEQSKPEHTTIEFDRDKFRLLYKM